jgi:hypothetical protein
LISGGIFHGAPEADAALPRDAAALLLEGDLREGIFD